jgi:hypothetical protein
MRTYIVVLTVLVFVFPVAKGQQGAGGGQGPNRTSETGYFVDDGPECGCKKAGDPDHYMCLRACIEKGHNLVFCRTKEGKYIVESKGLAAYAGYRVRIKGTVRGDTLTIASVEPDDPGIYALYEKAWVTDSMCGAKGMSAAHRECAIKCVQGGARWALVRRPTSVSTSSIRPTERAPKIRPAMK